MKKLLLTLFIVALCSPSFAQTNTKTQKIQKLLVVSGAGELSVHAMKSMVEIYKQSYSNVEQSFWDEFLKEASAEDFIRLLVPIYAKYYTEDDITKLIAFYQSPLGRKMVQTQPQLTQESMMAGQEWGRQVGEKVLKRLKEKGYTN